MLKSNMRYTLIPASLKSKCKPLTIEEQVAESAADTWNLFMQLENVDENDKRVFNEYIHRIQDMMFSRLYLQNRDKK